MKVIPFSNFNGIVPNAINHLIGNKSKEHKIAVVNQSQSKTIKEELREIDDQIRTLDIDLEQQRIGIEEIKNEIVSLDTELQEINKKGQKIDLAIAEIDFDIKAKNEEIAKNNTIINDPAKLTELRKEAKLVGQAVELARQNAPEYARLVKGEDFDDLENNSKKLLSEINEIEKNLSLDLSQKAQVIDYSALNKEAEEKIDSLLSEIKGKLDSFGNDLNENDTIMAINFQFGTIDSKFESNVYKNLYQDNALWNEVKDRCRESINNLYRPMSGQNNFFDVLENKLEDFAKSSEEYESLKRDYEAIESELSNGSAKDLNMLETLSSLTGKLKSEYDNIISKKKDLENTMNFNIKEAERKRIASLNSELLLKKDSFSKINEKLQAKVKFESIAEMISETIYQVDANAANEFKNTAEKFIKNCSQENMQSLFSVFEKLTLSNKQNIETLEGGRDLLLQKNNELIKQRSELEAQRNSSEEVRRLNAEEIKKTISQSNNLTLKLGEAKQNIQVILEKMEKFKNSRSQINEDFSDSESYSEMGQFGSDTDFDYADMGIASLFEDGEEELNNTRDSVVTTVSTYSFEPKKLIPARHFSNTGTGKKTKIASSSSFSQYDDVDAVLSKSKEQRGKLKQTRRLEKNNQSVKMAQELIAKISENLLAKKLLDLQKQMVEENRKLEKQKNSAIKRGTELKKEKRKVEEARATNDNRRQELMRKLKNSSETFMKTSSILDNLLKQRSNLEKGLGSSVEISIKPNLVKISEGYF